MTLLSHLSPTDPQGASALPLPADARLLALGEAAWQEALSEAADHGADPGAVAAARAWSGAPDGRMLLAAIFGNSPFLTGVAAREWEFLTRLVQHGADPLFDEIIAGVRRAPNDGENRAALMRELRIARRRVALTAAVADFAGAWDLEPQMQALTGFAEAAIDAALRHLLRTERGTPFPPDANPDDSGLIVLGMGKLGAGELNYSSDIDLILLYDPARAPRYTRPPKRAALLQPSRPRAGAHARRAHRRRLCLSHRSAPAPRPALDAAGHVGRGGARPITRASARTGSARR